MPLREAASLTESRSARYADGDWREFGIPQVGLDLCGGDTGIEQPCISHAHILSIAWLKQYARGFYQKVRISFVEAPQAAKRYGERRGNDRGSRHALLLGP